jgi:hypothetical protein
LMHRRDHDAVLQAHAPDLKRRKQHRLRHRVSLPQIKASPLRPCLLF